MSGIKILPELKSCLLPLSKEERLELERSLVEEGCRDNLVLWSDILIDGHNRFEICEEHNIPYKTIQKEFKNIEEVKLWIFKNQLARRNLNDAQKIEIAEKILEGRKKLAKEKQLSTLKQNTVNATAAETENTVNVDTTQTIKEEKINVNKEIGDMIGVSERTVARYNTIQNKAPEAVKEALKNNVVSINAGYEITKKVEDVPQEEKEEKGSELINQYVNKEFKRLEREKAISDNYDKAFLKARLLNIEDEDVEIWLKWMPKEDRLNITEILKESIENINYLIEKCKKINNLKVVK